MAALVEFSYGKWKFTFYLMALASAPMNTVITQFLFAGSSVTSAGNSSALNFLNEIFLPISLFQVFFHGTVL